MAEPISEVGIEVNKLELRRRVEVGVSEEESLEKNFLEEAIDITEDDVGSNCDKGSETDSGSYWSPIEEEEGDRGEDVWFDSQETGPAIVTAECVTTEEIKTALIKEYGVVDENEATRVQLENGVAESTPAVKEEDGNGISRDNGNLRKGVSDLDPIEENSTFQNFHSKIAHKLELQTRSPSFRVKNADVVDSTGYKARVEKFIESYDVIDQFDVKISKKEEFNSGSSFNTSSFHLFASRVKRTFSFRKNYPQSINVQQEENITGHVRCGTWPLDRSSVNDFVDISFAKRKDEGGEIVEVITVKKRKTDENDLQRDEVDASRASRNGSKNNGSIDQADANVDIGSADDLHHRPPMASPKHIYNDVDIISLSGFENPDKEILGIRDDLHLTKFNSSKGHSSQDSVFDEKKPTRPPRSKKNLTVTVSPSKRTASDSELHTGLSATDVSNSNSKRHSLQAHAETSLSKSDSVSKSEENIFRGILPFLDIDPKKRTLTGSSDKSVPPNKEELKLFTDAFPPQISEFPQDRRSLIALEVYTTERTFVKGLELLILLFKKKALQCGQLDNKEVDIVFSNVNSILDFNKGILDELYQRISDWSDETMIGDIFVANASKFKMYATYCQNYDASESFVKQKMKKKKDFETFLQSCYANPSCQVGLTLPSYLITIVQRTPRYILLLKDLLRKTPATHPDYHNLKQGLEEMEKIANFINQQLRQSQSEKALAALQDQIIGLKAYYFSARTLVHEGPVCLMNIKRTYQCVLFNDLLVFAVKGDSKQSEVELVLDLSIVWFEDLLDLDPQTTKQDAIGLYTPDRPYTIYVGKQGEKKIWLQNIKKAITNHVFGPEESKDKDLDKRNANYTYANGCVYSGDFLDSKRHGQGTMMWPNQMTYRGQWLDDERNGTGILEYGNGDVYDGEWENDRQSGKGICTYRSGDKITCEWKIGIRHGKATIEFANGDFFEGTFKNDRIEDEGFLACKNGTEYSGSWKRNKRNGKGRLKMSNGDVYSGEFKNDFFHGQGVIAYADGSVYDGEFQDGQRCGSGKLVKMSQIDGEMYEGQWLNDDREGHGKMKFSSGDIYEGTFSKDKRSGEGTMEYTNGDKYNGNWENDLMNGHGIMEYHNGDCYDGEWKDCQRHGKGKLSKANGIVYEGDWHCDLYHGKGVLEHSTVWKYKGDFSYGKRNGTGAFTDSLNDYKFQGEWKNDKKDGRGIEMIRGTLYEGSFKNDQRDGQGVETSTNTIIYEGTWRLGQKHGRGVRKLLNGMTQPQVWHSGCLMECPAAVSREVPSLQRF
eukprot:gene4729-5352_t